MMDAPDFQQSKLSRMTDEKERQLAKKIWMLAEQLEQAEQEMDAFYKPLLHACTTKEDALQLMGRVPDTISKVFYFDYILHQRDWSKPHLVPVGAERA